MKGKDEGDSAKAGKAPYKVRLPAFVTEDEIGLGDIVKHVTATIGVRPCTGCERRAAALNRWLAFTGHPK